MTFHFFWMKMRLFGGPAMLVISLMAAVWFGYTIDAALSPQTLQMRITEIAQALLAGTICYTAGFGAFLRLTAVGQRIRRRKKDSRLLRAYLRQYETLSH